MNQKINEKLMKKMNNFIDFLYIFIFFIYFY